MPDKYNKTFVEPHPEGSRVAPRVEVLPPIELPAAPITAPMPHSGHLDRARGFSLATAPLAAATAFVVLLIAIIAFGVPVLSIAALLCALAGFTAAWLIAYALHVWVSPDGALLAHTLLAWAYLRREQRERIRRYGKRD
jgi:hypothetical protein